MKQYPTIPAQVRYGGNWYVFDKLDGSNIRAEWSRKKGFHKFGSRKRLIGWRSESDQQDLLGRAIGLVQEREDALARVFRAHQYDRVVAFFEFFGPGSFAGLHEDEPHEVVLLDVHVHKRGMLDPRDFLAAFEPVVRVPALLHRGPFSKELESEIRSGELEGMTDEGVVAKAPRSKKWAAIDMFKVKNQDWIDRVKARYGEKAEAL